MGGLTFRASIQPTSAKAGSFIDTEARYIGSLGHGFLDNQILTKGGQTVAWNPDRQTWDSNRDSGILTGDVEITRS